MSDNTIKVCIQGSTLKFELAIKKTDTILAVKENICGQVMPDCQPTTLKLIYSGRILKDQQSVAECLVQNGQTVHLVKSSKVKSKIASAAVPDTTNAPPIATTTHTIPTKTLKRSIVPIIPIKPENQKSNNNYPPELDAVMRKVSKKAKEMAKGQPKANETDLATAGLMEEIANNPELLPLLMAADPEAFSNIGDGSFKLGQDPEWLRDAAKTMRHAALSGGAGEGPYIPGKPAPLLDLEAFAITQELKKMHNEQEEERKRQGRPPSPELRPSDLSPSELRQVIKHPYFLKMTAMAIANGAMTDKVINVPDEVGAMIEEYQEKLQLLPSPTDEYVPHEEEFQSQIKQLEAIGFGNKKRNVEALLESNGMVHKAIEYLVANPPK